MRLNLVAPALTLGLLTGWAALASADAPPAAPIFYCPTPGKVAPAPVPAKGPVAAPGKTAHVVRVNHERHHGLGCPTLRVAAAHHPHWRSDTPYAFGPPEGPHGPPPAGSPHRRYADGDVSASQEFIYRYERALHGLDARAADEAWAHGGPPPCHDRDGRCPPFYGRREMPAPPHAFVEQTPLPPLAQYHAYIERPPLPPPPERREYAQRAPQAQARIYIDRGPPPPPPEPPVERRAYVEHAPPPIARTGPPAYAWEEREGGAIRAERTEHASGWSYSEENGRGHYEHWGDDGHDGDGHWADGRHDEARRDDGRAVAGGYAGSLYADSRHEERYAEHAGRGPCPPVQDHACTAGLPRHEPAPVYTVAGRDQHGFLTWPGKTPDDR